MATTPKGVPYPLLTDSGDGPAAFEALAQWADSNAGIVPMTTSQRNALAGAALWPNRVIYNTTLSRFEVYAAEVWIAVYPAATSPAVRQTVTNGAGVNAADTSVWLRGPVAVVNISAEVTAPVAAGATLFTLPANARPVYTAVYGDLMITSAGPDSPVRIHVHTSGTVIAPVRSLSAGTGLRGSITIPLP